jgi:hypothetical protein
VKTSLTGIAPLSWLPGARAGEGRRPDTERLSDTAGLLARIAEEVAHGVPTSWRVLRQRLWSAIRVLPIVHSVTRIPR